jgi:RNA polymerase-binding transcription factor DksA
MQTNTLSGADLSGFRAALLSELHKLSAISRAVPDVLSATGPVAVDDQPALIHEQWVAVHARRIDHEKLQQIQAALDRIGQGDYGTCQHCGEPIARRRLQAIAWAEYCVPCQEQLADRGSEAA